MVIFELSRVDYPGKQPKYTQQANFEKLKKYYVYVLIFFWKMVSVESKLLLDNSRYESTEAEKC